MYPRKLRQSTNPIWLSQQVLLRAPTHSSTLGRPYSGLSLARSQPTADCTACALASAPPMAWPSPEYSKERCSTGSTCPSESAPASHDTEGAACKKINRSHTQTDREQHLGLTRTPRKCARAAPLAPPKVQRRATIPMGGGACEKINRSHTHTHRRTPRQGARAAPLAPPKVQLRATIPMGGAVCEKINRSHIHTHTHTHTTT